MTSWEKKLRTMKTVPFSWDDNLSEEAIEDFECIRSRLSYCTCQSIGMALAKLKMIENGEIKGKKVKNETAQIHRRGKTVFKRLRHRTQLQANTVKLINRTAKLKKGKNNMIIERRNA